MNFGERARKPSELKAAAYLLEHGKECDDDATQNARQQIQTQTGVCGRTILLELFNLYKFDPVNDILIDKMHLSFNMLKKEFTEKMWSDLKDNENLPPNQRNPASGGLLSRADLETNLGKVV